MQSIAIPTDDGALDQALRDLDTALAAWTEAMRQAHDGLLSAESNVERGASDLSTAEKVPSSESAEEIPVAPAETPQKPEQAAPQTESPSPALGPVTQTREAVAPAKPAAGQTSWRGTIEAISKSCEPGITAPPPARADTADAPAAAAPAPNEDEQLLASLDPKTAEAIRVMRRLSVEKKSVRELLNEYQAAKPVHVETATKKTSWWKRI